MLRSHVHRRPIGTLVASLAALCALGLSASPPLATGDRHRVKDIDAYLRPYPQSWFIGTIYTDEAFDVQGYRSGYYWGYAYGSYQGCAWVAAGSLHKVTESANAPDCGPPRRLPLPDSAHAPSHQAGGHLTFPYKTTCPSTGLYGNYRNGRHLHHKSDLPPNTPVAWRWTTADGVSAVVRYDAGNTWAFVSRSCIAPR
jgi:hypothetical protein